MDWLFDVDWHGMFLPETALLEIFLRGTLMYLAIFALLRSPLRRQAGSLGMPDIIVIVLIADAAQNGMGGEYKSIPSGILLIVTIMFWSFLLDWLAHRYPAVNRIVQAQPLLLIEDGRPIRRNMDKEFLTHDELISQLREQGVEEVRQVKRAYLEGNGKISVIRKDREETGNTGGTTAATS